MTIASETSPELRTPLKVPGPDKTDVVETPPPLPQPVPRATEASVAPPLKVATFDFQHRQAVLWEGGKEVRSTDWFPSAPEKGGKSPVMARFVFEEKNIIAKITGIWFSVLPTELAPDDKRPTGVVKQPGKKAAEAAAKKVCHTRSVDG